MQLLQNFKELTLRPKNAQELKGLILKLAVQGTLTDKWRSENPEIEAASKLLERLKVEKKKLIEEKKIKNEKPLPSIKKDDLINNLPNKWITVRLGEIGDWGAGSTPLRSNSLYYDGEINWFKSGELNNDIIDYESNEKITEFALKKASLRLNNPGDVLIAMYGATIGKTGILEVEGTTNQAVCACTPYSCISNSYLHLLLKALKDTFINQGEGGAQPNISRVKIRNQIFGLPPLEEQKAIIAVVETLFKEVEQLEQLTVERITLKEKFVVSALKQLTNNNTKKEWSFLQEHFHGFFNEISNIKKLRESVLQLAVQGKLTADWRINNYDIEDAAILLKRIQKEKAQLIKDKKIKKETPLPAISKDKIPYELPNGWVWCRMQEIGLFERGKSKHRPRNDVRLFQDGKYPLIQTGDVSAAKKNGGKISTIKSFYNDFGLAQSMIWKKGTLCITIAANIAETGFLDFDACFPDSVVGFTEIVKNGNYLANYVEYFITIMKSDLEKYAPSTAQKNINLGILYELKFPLPPLEEQKAIVEKVNALKGLCDELENEVKQSQEQSEKLMQSVLREVFKTNNSL